MLIHLLVLNYNGSRLLAECLPSVLAAAQRLALPLRRDGHRQRVERRFARRSGRAVSRGQCGAAAQSGLVLLQRRGGGSARPGGHSLEQRHQAPRRLHRSARRALVEPGRDSACFMAAPRCYQFDGTTYEGFKTAVAWRFGLVQATALFPGCAAETAIGPGLTASAGAAMAVDCRKFTGAGRLRSALPAGPVGRPGLRVSRSPGRLPRPLCSRGGGLSLGHGQLRSGLRPRRLRPLGAAQHAVVPVEELAASAARRAATAGACAASALRCMPRAWRRAAERWAFARALREAWRRRGQLNQPGYRARHDWRRERQFFRVSIRGGLMAAVGSMQ